MLHLHILATQIKVEPERLPLLYSPAESPQYSPTYLTQIAGDPRANYGLNPRGVPRNAPPNVGGGKDPKWKPVVRDDATKIVHQNDPYSFDI